MCEFYLTNKNCQNDKSAFAAYLFIIDIPVFPLHTGIVACMHDQCMTMKIVLSTNRMKSLNIHALLKSKIIQNID